MTAETHFPIGFVIPLNPLLRDGLRVSLSDMHKKRLTVRRNSVVCPQHTRQASIRKDTLNSGGFFLLVKGGRA